MKSSMSLVPFAVQCDTNTNVHMYQGGCIQFIFLYICSFVFMGFFFSLESRTSHSLTHRCGHDDVGILDLKEVIDLRVSRQLLTGQPKRTKLPLPVLKALAAQSFDWSH